MSTLKRPRRFAPLDPDKENMHNAPKLRGIVFDVDGTLCLPQNYMFREMRAALSIPKSVDILDHIKSLSNEPDHATSSGSPPASVNVSQVLADTAAPPDPAPTSPQARAVAAVKAIERTAMTSQRPQPGLSEVMTYLEKRNMRKALCTRNFPAPVHHLLDTHLPDVSFSPIITRETEGIAPKPSPEGLWLIAREWELDVEVADDMSIQEMAGGRADPLEWARQYLGAGMIMVGDSIDDLRAGRRAGAATVLLVNDDNDSLKDGDECDLAVSRLDDLVHVLEQGFAGRD
ncbi:uncharacterized protein HMPREF1541_09195 [Cyphellophora europaea CBS 101466]|uniref:HAD hydrolase, family IA n=1 Tax=Cyphellophora europaea (strain CBS 101466) TaxID=1220924 RepID=W2SBT5_CYPE1|nr:uncharacterized protein HMPREF1541_09195 [Cyphellophora europaea CBS 101466]ETN45364.1 hypothetical protein HMPREF1541_09195 [Cyphellophora europaea CBS 101466]